MTSSNNQMHNDIVAAGFKKQIEGENNDKKGELIAKTYQNTTAEVQDLTDAEAEVVQMILNGIGNDIYSTVDACPNAKEMCLAIEHLQQGESTNIHDVKTKLFWEFAKNMDNVSYHTLFDILNQHQNKANEIKDERIARNGNPLALVAATQHYPDNYPQAPKPYKTQAQSSRQRTSTRSHDTTKKKGKEGKKILICKKGAAGVQLSAKQSEWLHDIDDEPDDQELKAHYVDSNAIPDSSSMCTNERKVDKNAGKKEDEHIDKILAHKSNKKTKDSVPDDRYAVSNGSGYAVYVVLDTMDDPSTSTAGDIFEDEMMTIANTLVAIRSTRLRTTSVVIRNVEEEPRRATLVPIVQSQDKGKSKIVEPEPTPKNPIKAQIQRDAKIAQRFFKEDQAQFERVQRIARDRATEQEAKDAALIEQMEDIQASMDADELLAERLQQEDREQFTIEEKSRMLVEMIAERKSFEEIQKQYKREQKWINDFVPMDSEVVKDSRKGKAEGSRKKTVARKRTGEKLDDESVKRQKIEDDAEKEELKAYLDIIQGDDEAVNVESLATKQDVLDLYRLVKEIFETASREGYDRLLRGDLITVFEPSEDGEI
ncbi:hypothetical protein Tco_1420352 [Tanacetum coccineum]